MTAPLIAQLGSELAQIAADIDSLERGYRVNNLGNSSLSGYVSIYDETGQERARLGRQDDGTYVGGASINNRTPPVRPGTPIVEPGNGNIKIRVTGPEDPYSWPRDFACVNVWYEDTSGASILAGRVTSTPTEFVIAPLRYVQYRVWLTSVNLSGAESGPSASAYATPNRLVSDDILPDSIDGDVHLRANSITADMVMANSITAGALQSGVITADKLVAGIVIANATLQTGLTGQAMVQINSFGNDIRFFPSAVTNRYGRIFSYTSELSPDIALEVQSIASTAMIEICRFYVMPQVGRLFMARAVEPNLTVGGSVSVTPDGGIAYTYTNTNEVACGLVVSNVDGTVGYSGNWTAKALDSSSFLYVVWGIVADGVAAGVVFSYGYTSNLFTPTIASGFQVEHILGSWLTNVTATGFGIRVTLGDATYSDRWYGAWVYRT